MTQTHCILIGAPVDCGKRRRGCLMGPDAYRTAGLAEAITALGHTVEDLGNLAPAAVEVAPHANDKVYALAENVGWTQTLMAAAQQAAPRGLPIFLGGDHALALGTVAGMAAHAQTTGRPFFALWLDAHSDIHTPNTTDSGNLHGTPVGYVIGRDGFEAFPALPARVDPANICMIGLRSVDSAEHAALLDINVDVVDMRVIDESGIRTPLAAFLDRVAAVDGMLHVSLDVDFLDPSVAPAVGTTVPGGATVREGHLVMEMLCDSGLVTSLDLVELNPFLDDRGKTASLMVDLTASLLGRRVFDRPTRSHA
ncbi:MAG: arginase [Loktanella salsilacus]|jgi:arginase|uniref:Arginase n=1 Tax=Loktanella salsilacus TaxID=195913 RepID=A0A1I4I702_9RHOB|nr:arginase [Loktanella salsilacus]MBU0781325.1 arginase [Alphaproteobacteria bacterium]MBU1835590.1 arginase [Alphaproteobacteria bacterium]UTH45938.1 arginase [Loktanella salsilacus]UTH46805.1 arginase [Loktanella salsilacus]SFL50188.1 arginase [Loktanella salsilacus]